MKCIVKKIATCVAVIGIFTGFTGCGDAILFEQKYDSYATTENLGIGTTAVSSSLSFFAEDLCVGGNQDIQTDKITDGLSEAAGLFDLTNCEILLAKNIHEKRYPASTTKILTAYVALKYGDLNAKTNVSEQALQLEAGSSTCGLSVGDELSLEQLLYGLMLCSGNDAANVIAEMIGGTTENFAELMNQEARALGATKSHFVNAHGLNHEDHYTTVYDLYLIFCEAIKNETFCRIIQTPRYETTFLNRNGESVSKSWGTTNRYLLGEQEIPDGVIVIGGKTGTTNAAGSCLVLYSQDQQNGQFVSIVMKADGKENLYYQMTELLEKISN